MAEFETARITITRVLTDDGSDVVNVEASSDLAMVSALGMLRMAEDTLIQFPPTEQHGDEDDDEGDPSA